MRSILVTGSSSYIGTAFARYMAPLSDYRVDRISLRSAAWRDADFSQYDVVLHAAGIAHIRETAENAPLYYEVNRDLTADVARKAKESGVKHFIFLSSMSVYGLVEGTITAATRPAPNTNYGKSKLQAEELIAPLCSGQFAVSILRPPMVYGPGCRGNYQSLVKLAKIAPLCPDYENRRSMVSIDTLCAYLKALIDNPRSGIFFPQELAYCCTSRMICDIAAQNGRHLRRTRLLKPAVLLFKATATRGKKAFGNLIYQDLTELPLP
ncbi:MAG: NAD-dependent epimerase/dehydratase family protein [Clostridiales bacterium]|nr:NAD-dependent epimerase/dehydratase family protein [Candidatus Cacconaster stercorequi]